MGPEVSEVSLMVIAKTHEVEVCLAYARNSKEGRVAGAESMRAR